MRGQGVRTSARGLMPLGHLGWAYHGRAQLDETVRGYLRDGIAAGHWVEYVGDAEPVELRQRLRACPELRQAVDTGRVAVTSVWNFYQFSAPGVVDPQASVTARITAAQRALSAGWDGFRVAVDATAVARTPAQRAAFARFEFLGDQQVRDLPVSALCAYDVDVLGADAAAELVCLHPYTSPRSCLFRLYAEQGAEFALAGELDLSCRRLLACTLRRVLGGGRLGPTVIDGRALAFADHNSLLLLDRSLRRAGTTGVLRTADPLLPRIAKLLNLSHLRVETSGTACPRPGSAR